MLINSINSNFVEFLVNKYFQYFELGSGTSKIILVAEKLNNKMFKKNQQLQFGKSGGKGNKDNLN